MSSAEAQVKTRYPNLSNLSLKNLFKEHFLGIASGRFTVGSRFAGEEVCNGEGNGTPLQYSCLGNPMDAGAWWAAVHGVTRNRTQLSDFTFTFHFHALEKEIATQCSCLENPRDGGAW